MAATTRGGLAASARAEATVAALLAALATGDNPSRLLAEDVTFAVMTTGEVRRGRAAVLALLAHLHRQAFAVTPGARTLIATADRVMVEDDFAGTHVGEFAGIRPTGTTVRVPYAAAFDLTAGVITAIRVYLPLDALVRQIRDGAARGDGPSPAAGPPLPDEGP